MQIWAGQLLLTSEDEWPAVTAVEPWLCCDDSDNRGIRPFAWLTIGAWSSDLTLGGPNIKQKMRQSHKYFSLIEICYKHSDFGETSHKWQRRESMTRFYNFVMDIRSWTVLSGGYLNVRIRSTRPNTLGETASVSVLIQNLTSTDSKTMVPRPQCIWIGTKQYEKMFQSKSCWFLREMVLRWISGNDSSGRFREFFCDTCANGWNS